MNHHKATKHALPTSAAKTKLTTCKEDFSSFYSLQKHKQLDHGKTSQVPYKMRTGTQLGMITWIKNFGKRSQLVSFFDSDSVTGRQHLFIFASINQLLLFWKDKLQHVFENLNGAAETDLLFGFGLCKMEDGTLGSFMAQNYKLNLERSQHITIKEYKLE